MKLPEGTFYSLKCSLKLTTRELEAATINFAISSNLWTYANYFYVLDV